MRIDCVYRVSQAEIKGLSTYHRIKMNSIYLLTCALSFGRL